MRGCRHCSHENADHLSYCSQCGRRLVSGAFRTLEAATLRTAFSPTVISRSSPSATGPTTVDLRSSGMPAVRKTTKGGGLAAKHSRLGWAGDSIGYIYVYLRGKLDAEERRRRLTEERAGAEALLSGAINELAQTVLREGITHPDLTGLLEAIGRAHARREAAAADMAASDVLQQAEATRLGAQESAADAERSAADRALREAEEILKSATSDRRAAETRLGRVKEERGRLNRESGNQTLDRARSAELAHEAEGLADEQRALEEQTGRLDRELTDLRAKVAALRTAAATAKSKHEQAVGARRQAASAMAASIAGRQRDRSEAEHEVADLTAQLGRETAELRPPHAVLLSSYQTVDRLSATIADRTGQLSALEQAQGHYDLRKLMTGVGLLLTVLIAAAGALWAVLK